MRRVKPGGRVVDERDGLRTVVDSTDLLLDVDGTNTHGNLHNDILSQY